MLFEPLLEDVVVELDQHSVHIARTRIPQSLKVQQASLILRDHASMGAELCIPHIYKDDQPRVALSRKFLLTEEDVFSCDGLPLLNQVHVLVAGGLSAQL